MSTLIAGTDDGVSITKYARGLGEGAGYQVTWVANSTISHLSFDSEDKARAFYHLIYLSLEVA